MQQYNFSSELVAKADGKKSFARKIGISPSTINSARSREFLSTHFPR
jgi:hypothetical protein